MGRKTLIWISGLAAAAAPRQDRFTVGDRLRRSGPRCEEPRRNRCQAQGLAYPPARTLLRGLRLEVSAAGQDGLSRRLVDFPILAASGGSGPGLQEGDRQVPEGFYDVPALNPNSRFHAR
jgi:hypothetical protein